LEVVLGNGRDPAEKKCDQASLGGAQTAPPVKLVARSSMRRGAKSKGFVHLARCNRESNDPDKHLKDFEDFFPTRVTSASARGYSSA
jgi:hypothetical protein